MHLPRIVITGMGCVSAAGVGNNALSEGLEKGESLGAQISVSSQNEELNIWGCSVSDFDPKKYLDIHQIKRTDKSGQFFLMAGKEAVYDSNLLENSLNKKITGVFESSSIGGLNSVLNEHSILTSQGSDYVNPFMIIKGMNGIAGSLLAMEYKLHGPVMNISNGSVSSATAIYSAYNMLQTREVDIAITGGSEAPINYNILSIFAKAGVLKIQNENNLNTCCPFDVSRNGLMLGEGGGCIVMERLEDALKRNCRIYAEITGFGMTNDAFNCVAPADDGIEQSKSVISAMKKAEISIDELGLIAAHGTATQLNDKTENLALRLAFGDKLNIVPVTALKSIIGHSLGACTVIELIGCILSMHSSIIPPIANLKNPDPDFT